MYAHAAAVFQPTESPTAAVLQAVRVHIPADVTQPAESSCADSIHALQIAELPNNATMIAAEFSTAALQAAELADTAAMMAIELVTVALLTAELVDAAAVITTEFSTIASQPTNHNLEQRSDSTQAVSKSRQARYGHRGDAHIGEASHPGPKRTSNTDGPDTDVSGPRRVKTRASAAPC